MPLRDDLLAPIEGPTPAGPSLRYEPIFDQIKDARTESDLPVIEGDPWQGEIKTADWPKVVALSGEAIATRSKDLQLAVWLVEGLLRTEGFSALPAGIELLRSLQEGFWEGLHPEIDEGDLEYRVAPLEWFGSYLAPTIRTTPINRAGHSLLAYNEAMELGYEDDVDGKKKEARNAAIAEGKLGREEWDAGFSATGKEWYRSLVADLDASLAALSALGEFCDERYGEVSPSFIRLRDALTEVRRVASILFRQKLEMEPDPETFEEEDSAGESSPDGTPESDGGEETLSAEPGSRRDALARIVAVARFLRKEDPRDATPALLLRSMRWVPLRAAGPTVDPKALDAPPTAIRTRLRTLRLEERWAQLLEAVEEAMALPFATGWLDLQRYAVEACRALGDDYDPVASAILDSLRALLADLPTLPDLVLMDESPAASGETLDWLEREGLRSGTGGERDRPFEAADPWVTAQARARAGDVPRAIALLMEAAARERSARAQFVRRSQAAEIMVGNGMAVIARTLLRELLSQLEERQLQQWESPDLLARIYGLYIRCIDILGDDEGVRDDFYLRICRLDPMLAIALSSHDGGVSGESRG